MAEYKCGHSMTVCLFVI